MPILSSRCHSLTLISTLGFDSGKCGLCLGQVNSLFVELCGDNVDIDIKSLISV